ncbi:MAG TPA: ATP cone domain-containing protein, partial [Candidatus Hydrogenedentes bacterium]|nr:ATP cone domain-containing protein [Candidatus Hydrogenedentota bacterium]
MNSDRQDNLPFFDMPDGEGIFDRQMHMPLFGARWAAPVEVIVKRDGRREPFDKRKIAASILRAAPEGATLEADTASSIASAVSIYLSKRLNGDPASADQVSDAVERVLIQMNQVDAGLAYARYRDRRARIRRLRKGDMQALLSELEEARQERGAGLAKDMELNVQTSQDRLVKWNRSRIVEALQLETRLDAGMASVIAAEVEKQIEQAGITVLTASLVRELV